jgi:hypothetical protein
MCGAGESRIVLGGALLSAIVQPVPFRFSVRSSKLVDPSRYRLSSVSFIMFK